MNAALGPYRLDILLGQGGMGKVYRAWDVRLERWVAAKRLRRVETPAARAGLLREARAAASLGHPAILQVFDFLERDGIDWMVMELVEGPDLHTLLADGPLDIGTVLDYGRQIADGLAAAHAKGIIHRDLKTENVMVLPTGHVKVLDFGLAERLSESGQLAATGRIAGTPRAMSPEQAMGLDIDSRSDLFSLGVLLFELATVRSPFAAETPEETLARLLTHQPPKVSQLNPQAPAPLDDLVGRLLEKEPRDRPNGAADVVEALLEITSGTPLYRPSHGNGSMMSLAELTTRDGTPDEATERAVLRVLLACELVDSLRLVAELGDRSTELFRRHHGLVAELLAESDGIRIDWDDPDLVTLEHQHSFQLFELPWDAVRFALAYHDALRRLSDEIGVELRSRVGIHLGEVLLRRSSRDDSSGTAGSIEVEGHARLASARLLSIAEPGQILLTRAAYEVARRAATNLDDDQPWSWERLSWLEHGPYCFQGVADDVDVFEVGIVEISPLKPPTGSGKAAPAAPISRQRPKGGARLPVVPRRWPPPELPAEPYPVLLPYTHPDLMVGRELDLEELATRLRSTVLVTGLHAPSGTGKSSLLLAGLVPRRRSAGQAVAVLRHPNEPGVAARLLGDLLEHSDPVEDRDWQSFVERLAEVERLTGAPALLVLDQLEDILRPEAGTARGTLGILLAATARVRPGLEGPVARWLLAYRKEFHGTVVAWLSDILRDPTNTLPGDRQIGKEALGLDIEASGLETPGLETLPRDLSGPDRFQDLALSPIATPYGGGDDLAEACDVFQRIIEKPLQRDDTRYPWRFASGHSARLARAFAAARLARPDAPLSPELQVVLAHLVSRAGPDGVLTVPPDTARLVAEALDEHLRRALEAAFPSGSPVDRSRALLALRELAAVTAPGQAGRRDEGLPVADLAQAIGPGGEEILERLATPLTRLVVLRSTSRGPCYVLAHDSMAEVVVRLVAEEGRHGGLLVDAELLALRRFVALETALHRSGQADASHIPRRHYRRIAAHADALLWGDERRAWWQACQRRRRSELGKAVSVAAAMLVLLSLLALAMWDQARQRRERLALLDQVAGGEPEVALVALHELLARGDTKSADVLDALRQAEIPMDVLEHGLGAFEGEELSAVVLEVVELALPWVRESPEDPRLVANLVWALDQGPGQNPAFAAPATDLRDRVLEPLRRLRPPPVIAPGDPDWIAVAAGSFQMGSPADDGWKREHPRHEVTVSAFCIQRHEVTNADYRRLVPTHPTDTWEPTLELPISYYQTYFTADELPAAFVSWYAAYTYAAWLGGRLPTEAEWEYAARGSCPFTYCGRDCQRLGIEDVAWTQVSSPQDPETGSLVPSPVMQLEPNPWGLYDMIGSLWEWTTDWYSDYPTPAALRNNPWGPAASGRAQRVNRGGGFRYEIIRSRAAYRGWDEPDLKNMDTGFRVVFPKCQS